MTTSLRLDPVPVSILRVMLKPSGPVIPKTTTVPAGRPPSVMLSDPIARAKTAVTLCAEFIVTVQVGLLPAQGPAVQPENIHPAAGLAVSVTLVPAVTVAVHVVPQLMPPTLLVTVPVPLLSTVNTVEVAVPVVKVCVGLLKVPSDVTNRVRQ